MASPWGTSWGTSWGSAWGSVATADTWGTSWGGSWGTSWGRTEVVVPVTPTVGLAGGPKKIRRHFYREEDDEEPAPVITPKQQRRLVRHVVRTFDRGILLEHRAQEAERLIEEYAPQVYIPDGVYQELITVVLMQVADDEIEADDEEVLLLV